MKHENNIFMKPKPLITSIILMILASISSVYAGPNIEVKQILAGLTKPVAITHAGDGSGRLFITLQGGKILIYDGRQILSNPFLDISSLVSTGGEQGLLSVAFHPEYANNGSLYVNYTNKDGATVIARYRVSSDPNVAEPASAAILLTVPQPFENHNGGQLQFGPDGYLYIGLGDGGSSGDPSNLAQNPSELLGKMLRIDVDGSFPYTIPPDNPFVSNVQAREEIWAMGLRNPWRFSFDRQTGDMFIADVGQINWEELNFQPSGSVGGENYGWRFMEASHCYEPAINCNNGSLVQPILEYAHTLGNCSITAGYRYRGSKNPKLYGQYLYGDFCSGRIWGAFIDETGSWASTEVLDTEYRISAFGEDESGEIYFAHWTPNDNNGAIYLISQTNKILPHLPLLLLEIQ